MNKEDKSQKFSKEIPSKESWRQDCVSSDIK